MGNWRGCSGSSWAALPRKFSVGDRLFGSAAMTFQFSPVETEVSVHQPSFQKEETAPKHRVYRDIFKRGLDILLTVSVLPIVVPLVAVMAALIALDGHNPFYSQKRIGRGGKEFRMWKMRTMVKNADALLKTYLDENPIAKMEWDANQKLKNDPRITWVGRILRKSSMDELPQLWNVLNGTMSLVGPRPMMPCQRDEYAGTSYYRMAPGITGLWQVAERNDCTFEGRVKYDDSYDKILSLRTDIWVLAKTVRVVLRGTGY